jgi:YD repeat-containing protein
MRGNRTSFSYTARRQTGISDPLANQTTYRFDAENRWTLRIDCRGLRTSYHYDADNRITGLKHRALIAVICT